MVCEACTRVLTQGRTLGGEWEGSNRSLSPGRGSKSRGRWIEKTEHHLNGRSFQQAAEDSKCMFCLSLWLKLDAAEQMHILNYGDNPEFKYITWAELAPGRTHEDGSRTWDLSFAIDSIYLTGRDEHAWSKFVLQDAVDLPPSYSGNRVRIVQATIPPPEFSLRMKQARRWLETCSNKHARCEKGPTRHGWNPTRLLDVSGLDRDQVHLVKGGDLPADVVYVTLSHCWGRAKFLRLTTGSLRAFKHGIRLSSLPATFQDAVRVCRELSVSYLWIDSLCIIQEGDGLADWLREASFMQEVYTHASFNISATGANDSSGGLYLDHHVCERSLEHVDLSVNTASTHHERFITKIPRRMETVKCLAYSPDFWDQIMDGRVNHRAWQVSCNALHMVDPD